MGFTGLGMRCLSFEPGMLCAFRKPKLISFQTFCAGILGYQVYYSVSTLLIVIAANAGLVEDPLLKILSSSGCLSGVGLASGCKCSSCSLIHSPSQKPGQTLESLRKLRHRLAAVLETCESELPSRHSLLSVQLTLRRVRSYSAGAGWQRHRLCSLGQCTRHG